jgi:O-antigen/teichoic acid export membrane protein
MPGPGNFQALQKLNTHCVRKNLARSSCSHQPNCAKPDRHRRRNHFDISMENADALMEEKTIATPQSFSPEPERAPPRPRFSSRRAYAQTFTATAVTRCLGVVSGVLAARLLGPTGRGELAVIISLPMLLVPIGELELPRSLAFETSRVGENPRSLIATSFWVGLFLGCVQALVLAVALPLYLPVDKLHLLGASRWFVLYLPATLVMTTLMGSDQGKGRFGRFSFLLALPLALYVAAILASWAAGVASPRSFAAGLLIATLITFAVRMCMDWDAISGAMPEWQIALRLLRRGVSYYFPAVAGIALARADMFLLVRMAPSEAVGLYAVAQAIALGQIGAVNPFIQVSFSAVLGESDPRQALETLARHFRLAQLATTAVGLLAVVATPWVIRLMFGAGFSGAVVSAWLLTGAASLWGMEQVMEFGLRAAGHTRPGIVSNVAGIVVLAGAGIPACTHYGIAGLAAAALAAQVLNLATLIGYCVWRLNMPLRSFNAFYGDSIAQFAGVAASFLRKFEFR